MTIALRIRALTSDQGSRRLTQASSAQSLSAHVTQGSTKPDPRSRSSSASEVQRAAPDRRRVLHVPQTPARHSVGMSAPPRSAASSSVWLLATSTLRPVLTRSSLVEFVSLPDARRVAGAVRLGRACRPDCRRRLEDLGSDLRLGHTQREQRLPNRLDHLERPAHQEHGVRRVGYVVADKRRVDAADAILPALVTFGDGADEADVRMPAGQRAQLVPEHQLPLAPGRVDQGDRPSRLGNDPVPEHADERRDSYAAGDEHDRPVVSLRIREPSGRRLRQQRGARPQRGVQRARDDALPFDGNLQVTGGFRRGADRVASHLGPAVRLHLHREELTREELECRRACQPERPDRWRLVEYGQHRQGHEVPGTRARSRGRTGSSRRSLNVAPPRRIAGSRWRLRWEEQFFARKKPREMERQARPKSGNRRKQPRSGAEQE